jgi:hypothetical protein
MMNSGSEAQSIAAKQLRDHAARWKAAGPELERLRLQSLRGLKTVEAVEQLWPAFIAAAKLPPRQTSGLVEQQRIFKKLHPRR